jgi:hypothetical protein
MRRLSLTLLAAGAVLAGAAPRAHAQYFNYLTDFETPGGGHVVNVLSLDTTAALGINDVVSSGKFAQASPGTPVSLYAFATNSTVASTDPKATTAGVFNFPYKVSVTMAPSDALGNVLPGYAVQTQFVTGTITGQLTQNINTLANTYDNLVSTPSGQAQVLNYVFTAAGLPTIKLELRALAGQFNNGGTPVPKAGNAGAAVVGTPEPGSLAMLCGMGFAGAAFARRRSRRS